MQDIQEQTAEKIMYDDDGELVFAGPPKKPKEPRITLSFTPGDIIFAEKFVANLKSVGIEIKAMSRGADGSLTYYLGGHYVCDSKCKIACEGAGNTA